MATQGLITIQKNGTVAMKIVAGCNGMQAPALAAAIRRRGHIPGPLEVYTLALGMDFGCKDCLVVVDKKMCFYQCDGPVGRLYRRTFRQPRFNPRWNRGTADHVRVVNF